MDGDQAMKRILPFAMVLFACSDSTGSTPASLSGQWEMHTGVIQEPQHAGSMTGEVYGGIGLTVVHDQSALIGQWSGGTRTSSFSPFSQQLGSGTITTGVVRGDSVFFDLNLSGRVQFRGRASGGTMAGVVTLESFGASGSWWATRR